MAYTKPQASKIAEQIHSRFGGKIAAATDGTPVPQEFVAGLIGVEAGKDHQGRISETATRFEAGVFRRLQQVRDGVRKSWSGIRQPDIKDTSDSALRNLSTSFGLCQVMGWHTIHNLDCTVAELRDPGKHLGYAVKLLMLNAADGDFERKEYVGEFKEWNSGSETGKTFDPNYVANAGAVMDAYRELGPAEPLVTDSVTEGTPATPEVKPETQEPPATEAPSPVEAKQESKVTVQKVAQSIGSKLLAGGALVGSIGSALLGAFLGVIKNPYAFAIIIVGGAYIAVYAWNKSKDRQLQLQRDLIAKAAAKDLNTVVVQTPPAKTEAG